VAQKAMQRLSDLKEEVSFWQSLAKKARELTLFLKMAQESDDENLMDETLSEVRKLQEELARQEFILALGGPYDARGAYLSIHAGAGGTESCDWAQMLLRMYLRWAEVRSFSTQVLETTYGDEAGIKSVTVAVNGRFAYGYLKAERGVHRLVRLSPFDAARRRHTSFALVEVLPQVESDLEVEIGPSDLRIDTFRATGAGGQHVNKTDSAVRITHLPTNIVVSCQNERSQAQNKEAAMKILQARLLELQREAQEAVQLRLKGEHISAGCGNQIRSYVLHPYNMVKDHRTGYETSNTSAVLDGDIEPFIEAYLASTLSGDLTPAT